ncbi:MAG: creatininase family protein, partial [Synechococcaceae cyanobacterium RL_1_2]|nr:creatininase family protein [Synechococcaceae cyanobacterium RL_1_2]
AWPYHHLGFPGSISLKPSTMILYVKDYLTSLAGHGFRRFFFINGHGGNVATLKAAFAETYGSLSDREIEIRCELQNWYMVREVYQLAQKLYGDQEGSHATPSEVALTQYAYPEEIKSAPLDPHVAKGFPIYSAKDFRDNYPDGRMGSNPDLATPDHGKQFYEAAVKALSKNYEYFIAS